MSEVVKSMRFILDRSILEAVACGALSARHKSTRRVFAVLVNVKVKICLSRPYFVL